MIRRCYLAFPVEIFEILLFLEQLPFCDVLFRFPPFFFGSLYCFMVFFCLRRDLHVFVFASVLLFASVFVFLFYGCFCLRLFLFSVLISFFSVFRFRAISTFFSGIRGPLERGARMAGTGGLVKRPNFDNASFA